MGLMLDTIIYSSRKLHANALNGTNYASDHTSIVSQHCDKDSGNTPEVASRLFSASGSILSIYQTAVLNDQLSSKTE